MIIGKHFKVAQNYSITDITKMLGVANSSVYRWIKNGELKATKDGRDYFITQTALKEFLSINPKFANYASDNSDGEAVVQLFIDAVNDVDFQARIEKELKDLRAAKELIEDSINFLNKQKRVIERFQSKLDINRVAV